MNHEAHEGHSAAKPQPKRRAVSKGRCHVGDTNAPLAQKDKLWRVSVTKGFSQTRSFVTFVVFVVGTWRVGFGM
jgi:hypothetical protein